MPAIKNGRIFGSKAAAYQVICQGREPVRWNVQGEPIEWLKELTAEFAYHGGDFLATDHVNGTQERFTDIRGHMIDTAQQAEEKGWTQAEHDYVVEKLERQCKLTPEYCWEVTAKRAEKPWGTYDETHASKIAGLAEATGNVAAALRYERENKDRPSVVAALEELVAKVQEEPVESDLVAS